MSEQKFIWLTDLNGDELIIKIENIIAVKKSKNQSKVFSQISFELGGSIQVQVVSQTVQEILKYIEPKWFPKGYKTVAVDVELGKVHLCSYCGIEEQWDSETGLCDICYKKLME